MLFNLEMKKYFIYWILLLALLCRSYHITFPVEGWHAWRQADAAAIARNFLDNGFDIFYPQINHGGDSPGYVDTEFPLYPYLVALLWKLFGVNDGWGRFLSVLSSLGTIYVLYALVRKYVGERAALWSAFMYSILPLNIYYGRTFMPHALVLFCTTGGIYFFSEWLENKKNGTFVLSASLIAAACLMNPTSLVIGLPLAFLSRLSLGKQWIRSSSLWICASAVILPTIFWFGYSRLVLYSPDLSIGIWEFGTGKWGNIDLLISPKFYNDIIFKSIAERHLTYPAFILFVAGLFLPRHRSQERLFDYWLLGVVGYFLIVPRGNSIHEYYQLPFMLPAVVYIGKTCAVYIFPYSEKPRPKLNILAWLVFILLLAVIPLSFLRYKESFAQREIPNSPMTRLADEMSILSAPHDLVITVSEGDPLLLYRSHRKGWVVLPDNIDSTYIVEKHLRGAKYVAGLRSIFDSDAQQIRLSDLTRRYPPLKETPDYFVIQLDPR